MLKTAQKSFYHLAETELKNRHCRGLACFAARGRDTARWGRAVTEEPQIHCLGKCYIGPASTEEDQEPRIESRARQTMLLGNLLTGGVRDIRIYQDRGGFTALEKALGQHPDQIISELIHSGLRGRGGAGFPAGRKWSAVAAERHEKKYVVVNADEGDAGSFSDRFLMEGDPFLLIEGTLIAARAVGARYGFIYLRKEYPQARRYLETALSDARRSGYLGEKIKGSDFSFDLELTSGEGSYLCGEETAMLNAIEGRRGEARNRPPFIFAQGLHGCPTLVNNVETLAAVPWIIRHGAGAYRESGFSESAGTKLISLPAMFKNPGLYEIDFGVTLREIVYGIGGGLADGNLRALMIGGPLAGLLPATKLDTRFGYEELQAVRGGVGHGGVIGFSDATSIRDIAREIFSFGAYESCGKCTPCHKGTPLIAEMFAGEDVDKSGLRLLVNALAQTSLCGHGRGLADFAFSLEEYFSGEF